MEDTAATPQSIKDAMDEFIESNQTGLDMITNKIKVY